MKYRILLAGFGAFGELEINPAQLLVEQLAKEYDLPCVIIPTSYSQAWPTLQAAIEQRAPDYVIAFGVGRTTAALRLERVARNVYTAGLADVDGDIRTGKIQEAGAAELFTEVSVPGVAEELLKRGHDVIISSDAGGYVCNQLYYQGLYSSSTSRPRPSMLFAHISGPDLDSRSVAAAEDLINWTGWCRTESRSH